LIKSFRLQRYNYEKGCVEPIDLSGAEIEYRLHKPQRSLDVTLTNEQTGKEIKRTLTLTEDEGVEYGLLKTEEEKQRFARALAEKKGVLSEMLGAVCGNED